MLMNRFLFRELTYVRVFTRGFQPGYFLNQRDVPILYILLWHSFGITFRKSGQTQIKCESIPLGTFQVFGTEWNCLWLGHVRCFHRQSIDLLSVLLTARNSIPNDVQYNVIYLRTIITSTSSQSYFFLNLTFDKNQSLFVCAKTVCVSPFSNKKKSA